MGWQERLRQAAYTSPSGTRITFDYEGVSRDIDKRTAGFEFPGVNDAYVQDNGFGARKYALRCYFWGPDHDLVGTAFELGLCESGIGRLEHPLYGTFDVVPFGSITRREDLKSEANQTVIEVTFWSTVRAVYPSGAASPKNELEEALDGFDVAASQQFAASVDLSTVVARANERSTVLQLLRTISGILGAISDVTSSVRRAFEDEFSAIQYGIDVLVGQPLQLAQQITNLIQTPARAHAAIAARLQAYGLFAERLMASSPGTGKPEGLSDMQLRVVNDFLTVDLSLLSAVTGSVIAVQNATFTTRSDALGAADTVIAQFDSAVGFRDARFNELGILDTGEAYEGLLLAVGRVAGFAVEQSFSLATERRIVLDRPRTIIDLAGEIYGSVDDRLDLLININELTGSEILELPRGRAISYYA